MIGETIWDRGSYDSVVVEIGSQNFHAEFANAIERVLGSAHGRRVGLVVQSHVQPRARGEFGNLLRVSKTRDHWELSSEIAGTTSRIRFNAQRDEAANPASALEIRSGVPPERVFGSVAAYLNNYLFRGRSLRVNCEWIAGHDRAYLVQIDEESEDFAGVNPFQLRVAPIHYPTAAEGIFLRYPGGQALNDWDKLSVLNELWEPQASHKPTLFYVPLSTLPAPGDPIGVNNLEADFRGLIGPDNIVVRTSVRGGAEKVPNLSRTEGLDPAGAAKWCLARRDSFLQEHGNVDHLAFIAHRFMAARASAWVRAEVGNPVVEIHSLWGLPDALQYCPYDIWEVHLPTEAATEYPDYKSHMLIPRDDGGWEYARVKNEFGRSLSIGRREAIDIATRTAAIANRLDKSCHVMWFIGCIDANGGSFSIPWYWTLAHETEKNLDRSSYQVFSIANQDDLLAFRNLSGSRTRQALELTPKDQMLMRDMGFIGSVGATAKELGVPVVLAGSTLAHAYFELRRQGCTVVARGDKDHSRVRRNATFGKLVRDKIPARIASRKEVEITKRIPRDLRKSFLTSKLLEEALEVRNARSIDEKRLELADLFEVVRALAQVEGVPIEEVVLAADDKKRRSGGFDDGLVLLQTGILGRGRDSIYESDKQLTQVLARRLAGDSYELPFTFFGFMELDQPRSIFFDDFGIRLHVVLKSDRIELRASREAEQLELPLDLTVTQFGEGSQPGA
ncbi:nucleoside triphosphate pyrophosphohydrolase [Mesorhizobium sp. M0340]|uniref:nucleoside triphosphate pyrophosphohydrolase n=1 Tax=Mesorhizobium sp. M0340 TaxID=2956939 RepID=UPI003337461F